MKSKGSLTAIAAASSFLIMISSLLIIAPASAQTGKPIEIKAVTFYPESNELCQGFWMLRDRVNERAKGELVIKWVGGPEAIGPFQQGAAVKSGVVDMAWIPGSLYKAQVPAAEVLSFSVLTPQEERQNGAYDFMNGLHKAAGIFYLGRGYVNAGLSQFNIFTNKRVKGPKDLAGLKIGPGTIVRPFQQELGIVPVTMPHGDLYGALERGIVDGLIQPMVTLSGFSWHERVKYMIEPSIAQSNITNIINLNTWNKLPKHLQNLLMSVQSEIERDVPAYDEKFKKQEWAKLKKAGMEVISFSPADSKWLIATLYKAEWDDQMKKLPPDVGPKLRSLFSK